MEAPPCVLIRKVTKYSATCSNRKIQKTTSLSTPVRQVLEVNIFFEILVSPLAFNCQSVGALFLSAQKCGSSCFKRQKVWELSFPALKTVGALVSSVRKCGCSRFKRSKVWELLQNRLHSRQADHIKTKLPSV